MAKSEKKNGSGKKNVDCVQLSDFLIYSARLYRSQMTRGLLDHGLYTGQDKLLDYLSEDEGKPMGELALYLSVRPPTVTKMVTRLSAQGLVERKTDPQDSRSSLVFLSSEGAALLGKIRKARKKVAKSAFSELKKKDRRRLNNLLLRISGNLSNPDGSSPNLPN